MLIIPFSTKKDPGTFKKILAILKDKGIVAYPTESFYALGVIATDPDALKRLFEIKQRSFKKPVPVIVDSIKSLSRLVRNIPREAENLMKNYWPGPLTLMFEASDHVPSLLTGNTGRIAVRIPGKGPALVLAKAVKLPITATSANISSLPASKTPEEVIRYFDDNIDLLLDCGETPGGKPSTIIDVTVTPFRILRHGKVIPDINNES